MLYGVAHGETEAFVVRNVLRLLCLEIGGHVGLVAESKSLVQERGSDSGALEFGIDTDQSEIPMRFFGMDFGDVAEHAHCFESVSAFDERAGNAQSNDGLAPSGALSITGSKPRSSGSDSAITDDGVDLSVFEGILHDGRDVEGEHRVFVNAISCEEPEHRIGPECATHCSYGGVEILLGEASDLIVRAHTARVTQRADHESGALPHPSPNSPWARNGAKRRHFLPHAKRPRSVLRNNGPMPGDRVVTTTSFAAPLVGALLVALTWGTYPSAVVAVALAVFHVVLVIVTVHHAEVIAHRVGEPFGTLVLALAVTVIEVSLIVTLMATEGEAANSLARDTVFAAIMIVCNGVVGASIIADARRDHIVRFSEQGANALLGTVMTIATLSLVMPTFTESSAAGTFTPAQLAFSAIAAALVYALFIFVQTGRHRWMFLSPEALETESHEVMAHVEPHAARTGRAEGLIVRTVMLILSLAGVVGLAKTLAPSIEDAVQWAGAPRSFVGVVIALMVLLPESVAALRAASRGEMQTSLNLSLGSALASIGLTIPAIAVASIWLDGEILLGLGGTEIVLLVLTAAVSILTFGSGRATVLQGGHHLALFAAFIFLAVVP